MIQAARRLETQGRLRRFTGPDGNIVNELPDSRAQHTSESTPPPVAPGGSDHSWITEDEVKEAVRANLTARGFDVAVTWGRARGIDIDARHLDGRRYLTPPADPVVPDSPGRSCQQLVMRAL